MFEKLGALVPLRETAELLAEHAWLRLYDAGVLAANEEPAAAAPYSEDIYAERPEGTPRGRRVARVGQSEYEHHGLRVDGGRIPTASSTSSRPRPSRRSSS